MKINLFLNPGGVGDFFHISNNSEAFISELPENIEEMFLHCYIYIHIPHKSVQPVVKRLDNFPMQSNHISPY